MFVLIQFHVLCEIRAYIYEKNVEYLYDILRVTNSFSVCNGFIKLSFFISISFRLWCPQTRHVLLYFSSS